MERPKITDKKVAEYVAHLEEQLDNYKADNTNARLYLGVKRQLDDMAVLLSQDIEVENPLNPTEVLTVKFMDFKSLSSKDDKFFDRFMKIMDKFKEYMVDLKEVENIVNPEVVEKVTRKDSGSIADKYAFNE